MVVIIALFFYQTEVTTMNSNESLIVMIFKDAADAARAESSLGVMNEKNEIALGNVVMLRAKENGEFERVKRELNGEGMSTLVGMGIGGLATLFAGPMLFFIGMLTGTAVGAGVGYNAKKISKSFVEDVKKEMKPGDMAVIANCRELKSGILMENMQNYENAKFYCTGC